MGGGQNLERQNVQRSIFWNFKIAYIKITIDELFNNFIFEFNFSFFRNHLDTKNIQYFFKLWNIDFSNDRLLFFILRVVKFKKIVDYRKLVDYYIIS